MRRDFLKAVRVYVARSSVTASALRGRAKGTVGAAREFFGCLPLKQFGVERASLFYTRLDIATEALRLSLPKTERYWGVSRKALNIFLRNAFYNTYLNERYRLSKAEWLYEVPIDSIVAKELHLRTPGKLPKWQGVMHLRPEQNQLYQEEARRVANKDRMARVHLDVDWWGGDRKVKINK